MMARRSLSCVIPVLIVCACASQNTLVPKGGFVQSLGRTNELVGRIYAVGPKRFATASELDAALEEAEFLVLGESHDNRDHHALEAELTARFLDSHPNAAVGFEMLDEDVRSVVRDPPRDPDAFARAVKWPDSGWPEFSQYLPVFEVALARTKRLIAAHPSGEHVRASLSGVPEAEARALHLDVEFPALVRAELEQEIRDAHCGHAVGPMITAMVRAQSYKDAFMARSMFAAGAPGVLITGRGHARNDRAVPLFMQRSGVTRVLSVAFVEVEDTHRSPADYDVAHFDYVVFTPRVSDEDPCAKFEKQRSGM